MSLRFVLPAITVLAWSAVGYAQPAQQQEEPRHVLRGRDGRSYTYVFSADSDLVLRSEDEASITEYAYQDGTQVAFTVTVRASNAKLTVQTPKYALGAEGLPAITQTGDPEGRVTSVRTTEGEELASYEYQDGYLRKVQLNSGVALHLSKPEVGRVKQTLKSQSGQVVREVVAAGSEEFRYTPFVLDLVANDLGLGERWRQRVRSTRSASRRLTTVTDETGHEVLYLVHEGSDMVAFSPDGVPLFYDVSVNVWRHVLEPGTDIAIDEPARAMTAVTPDRIVLTRGGATEAYISSAASGAIQSFWTAIDADARASIRHRIFERAAN